MQDSIWEKESFFAHRDVIIIGAGLAGLWSAYELHEKNSTLKILVLESGLIPAGASTRNAGFACFGSPTELLNDCHLLGEDNMWAVAEMRYRGIEKTKAHFKDNLIAFDHCGGYELLKTGYEGLKELPEKLDWLNKGLKHITGKEETFVRNDAKLATFKFKGFAGLIENNLEGGLHSGKLVQALSKKVLALGIEIMYSAKVGSWESNNVGVTVNLASNRQFTASKLLFCSNAFTTSLVKNMQVTPARGQILLTEPVKGLAFSGTFHYDEGYYYFRNLGNRILMGGARNLAVEEETTTALETTSTIQTALQHFLSTHILPGQPYHVAYRWAGIMGFNQSKMPEVRNIAPSTYSLITCNGMGVALAPVMAEKAAAAVLA